MRCFTVFNLCACKAVKVVWYIQLVAFNPNLCHDRQLTAPGVFQNRFSKKLFRFLWAFIRWFCCFSHNSEEFGVCDVRYLVWYCAFRKQNVRMPCAQIAIECCVRIKYFGLCETQSSSRSDAKVGQGATFSSSGIWCWNASKRSMSGILATGTMFCKVSCF